MATIVGRKREQHELRRKYESDEAELLVVYGRRRVGKTFLINNTFAKEGFAFKVTGLHKKGKRMQLRNFVDALREYSNDNSWKEPNDWMEAFEQLRTYLKQSKTGEKRILFIDEMPWMDTRGSQFLSAFERFWNNWGAAESDLMLIVCGSATNWIINKLFKNKGGLYNRSDCRMYLNPFTLQETEQYLIKQGFELEQYDIAQIYMIMGGIPFYLKQLDPALTLSGNIDECFFREKGKLWDEYDRLFETLFERSDMYTHIIEALGTKQIGLTREELLRLTGLPDNGVTSKAIKDLINCGYLRTYRYWGRKTKTQTYQLADFYLLFYLRFVRANYGQDQHYWSHVQENGAFRAWQGYAFEQLCMNHLQQVKNALGIGAVRTTQSSWHIESRDLNDPELHGAQIDLLIDRSDRFISLCEMKFANAEYVITQDYSMNLRNKMEAFKQASQTRKTVVMTMISTFGVKRNAHSGMIKQQVVLDDLFRQE